MVSVIQVFEAVLLVEAGLGVLEDCPRAFYDELACSALSDWKILRYLKFKEIKLRMTFWS